MDNKRLVLASKEYKNGENFFQIKMRFKVCEDGKEPPRLAAETKNREKVIEPVVEKYKMESAPRQQNTSTMSAFTTSLSNSVSSAFSSLVGDAKKTSDVKNAKENPSPKDPTVDKQMPRSEEAKIAPAPSVDSTTKSSNNETTSTAASSAGPPHLANAAKLAQRINRSRARRSRSRSKSASRTSSVASRKLGKSFGNTSGSSLATSATSSGPTGKSKVSRSRSLASPARSLTNGKMSGDRRRRSVDSTSNIRDFLSRVDDDTNMTKMPGMGDTTCSSASSATSGSKPPLSDTDRELLEAKKFLDKLDQKYLFRAKLNEAARYQGYAAAQDQQMSSVQRSYKTSCGRSRSLSSSKNGYKSAKNCCCEQCSYKKASRSKNKERKHKGLDKRSRKKTLAPHLSPSPRDELEAKQSWGPQWRPSKPRSLRSAAPSPPTRSTRSGTQSPPTSRSTAASRCNRSLRPFHEDTPKSGAVEMASLEGFLLTKSPTAMDDHDHCCVHGNGCVIDQIEKKQAASHKRRTALQPGRYEFRSQFTVGERGKVTIQPLTPVSGYTTPIAPSVAERARKNSDSTTRDSDGSQVRRRRGKFQDDLAFIDLRDQMDFGGPLKSFGSTITNGRKGKRPGSTGQLLSKEAYSNASPNFLSMNFATTHHQYHQLIDYVRNPLPPPNYGMKRKQNLDDSMQDTQSNNTYYSNRSPDGVY